MINAEDDKYIHACPKCGSMRLSIRTRGDIIREGDKFRHELKDADNERLIRVMCLGCAHSWGPE